MKKSPALLTALLMLSPIAQAAEMAPGLWNLTINLDAPGIPEQMRTQQQQDCLSVEDAKDPEASLRKSWQEDSCSDAELKKSGNTLSWSATCNVPGTQSRTHITGKMVMHNSKHYTSELTMKGNNHQMKTVVEGKWAGKTCQE